MPGATGDASGLQGSTGTEVTGARRGRPSMASWIRATVSGESPFFLPPAGGCAGRPVPGAACAAFAAACSLCRRCLSPRSMRLSASARRASSSGESGSSRRPRSARGGDHERPQDLDEEEPRVAVRPLAELPRPHRDLAVGLLLPAYQLAAILGVAADGRARAGAAPLPDQGRDLVDGGALCDGLVDGLAQRGRQPLDARTPVRSGCLSLGGFALHPPMLTPAPAPLPPHHGAHKKGAHPRRFRPPSALQGGGG